MDVAPEKSTVSISWLIVADLLPRVEAPQSTHPDIIGWVGWINNAGAAW